MSARPSWGVEGIGWPHREASRFVTAGGIRWHVQTAGPEDAPALLLLHGTGAATHSWRGLLPLLATRWRVVAPDLPGHGFTDMPTEALTLPSVAARTAALLTALELLPVGVVGHSAGAAIALRMALDGALPEGCRIVAINGALSPFAGMAAPLFQGLARLLFANPAAAWMFAAQARDPMRIRRLIAGTGSTLDDAGIELYARLLRNPGHVAGALGMMAAWDLETLRRAWPSLRSPLTLVVGTGDLAVPPATADAVAASVTGVSIVRLEGLGHLAHEEAPERVAEVIERIMAES